MKNAIVALFIAAISLTATVAAQAQEQGPPSQIRAQMEQIRSSARTAAFNDLSSDHRARVQAIINQVNSGSLDRQAAAQQIDEVLSPSESQAILAQGSKMRDAMRTMYQQRFQQNGAESQSAGAQGWHGGGQRGPGGPGGSGMQRRAPDAGRMLLMLGANRPQPQPR